MSPARRLCIPAPGKAAYLYERSAFMCILKALATRIVLVRSDVAVAAAIGATMYR